MIHRKYKAVVFVLVFVTLLLQMEAKPIRNEYEKFVDDGKVNYR